MKFDQYNKGDLLEVLDKGEITHNQIIRYAGASGDFNPIHNDPAFAQSKGLGGTIAHGMLIMGFLGQYLSQHTAIDRVRSFKVGFKNMTRPGERILCKGKIKRKIEQEGKKILVVQVSAENEQGEVKASGDAEILAD